MSRPFLQREGCTQVPEEKGLRVRLLTPLQSQDALEYA